MEEEEEYGLVCVLYCVHSKWDYGRTGLGYGEWETGFYAGWGGRVGWEEGGVVVVLGMGVMGLGIEEYGVCGLDGNGWEYGVNGWRLTGSL